MLFVLLTLIRETGKKSKTRDRHRACFPEKSGAQRCIICLCFCALDCFPENTLPEKWHIFCSAQPISSHIGICHLKLG